MEKILITGASGFIGRHAVEQFLAKGYAVRAVYRRATPPEELQALAAKGVELVNADLNDKAAYPALLEGVQGLVHIAALAGDWGPFELYKKLNYDMTVDLMTAAKENGVSKVVFIGSLSIQGFGNHENSTEEGPYYPLIVPYQTTKKMAEDWALEQHSDSFKVSVIRPGNVYGPGDTTTFFPIFDGMHKGIMGYIGDGKTLTCPVYVTDIVQSMILAYENPKAGGEAFNITAGDRITWEEQLTIAANYLGIKAPKMRLPVFIASPVASIMMGIFRLFGSKSAPPLTQYRVTQLGNNYHFDISKARNLLGYAPQMPFEEGMRLCVEDYKERRAKGEKFAK